MNTESIPPIVEAFARQYPEIWEAYNSLGKTAAQTAALDPKTERLLKLAIAVGAGLQGAVHSHVRRGLAAGLTPEELKHVALLAITTVGWPSAIAALSWIDEEIEDSGENLGA